MIDQATELRKLVVQSLRESAASAGPPPRLIVVTGAAGGVGATSLAVNLAVAFAEQGLRVVIVDVDPDRADVTAACGICDATGHTTSSGIRRDIHEVMLRGPAGIQIVPGICPPGQDKFWDELSQERLLRQFKTLGRHADVVMLDAGGGDHAFLHRCRRAADDVLLVTTPDAIALTGCQAQIQAARADQSSIHWRLVVNHCPDPARALQAQATLQQWCEKDLPRPLELLGNVPTDETVQQAATKQVPFVINAPNSPAARSIQQLATILCRPTDTGEETLPAAA